MIDTTRLDRLEAEADQAARTYGVESREYADALVKVGREEARLTRLVETPEARYVRTYRPY